MATSVCKQAPSKRQKSFDMFSVKEGECVGFDSIWKVKRVYSAGSTQTSEYRVKDTGTDATPTADCEVQTDERVSGNANETDAQKLSDWMKKIYPLVSKELNETGQAFKNYKKSDGSVEATAKLMQALKVHAKDGDNACKVGALSWNCTGNTLAVACNRVHKTWCHHPGLVCLYTFNRHNKFPSVPRKKLLTETCVTVASFHPSLPAVIAAGTYSGVVVIWNTQYDEGDNVVCKVNGHEEYVTQMSWIADSNVAKTIMLATSSLDGYLNVWNFSLSTASLTAKQKYRVKAPLLGKLQRAARVPEDTIKKGARGIIAFDFSPYVPDVFVVGAEGGLVIQCSSLGTAPLKGGTKDFTESDPTYKYYEGHEGEVVKVSFSPHRREMFLSSGTDGQIRIYVLGQDEPAQVIFAEKSLACISWVPLHDKILTGCGTKGAVEIYKLISGRAVDVKFEEKVDVSVLTQMELNRERASIVAVGNANGTLQIWSVPWDCYNYDD